MRIESQRAVIYCRVSTKEQVSNLSLATQERMCRDYCERNGFSVDAVFIEEGASAKSLKRDKLIELLAYCRSARPRVSALVVHSLSRFSRDVGNHHEIRNILLGTETRLHSVTEKIENTPQGKLMETIVAGLAQYENDAKAERTVQGMKEAHRLGRWTWTAPIGYLNGIRRTPPSLLPDPERADLVRQAFELAASGKHSKADVLRLVSALGLRTRKGKLLTAQSLGTMLANPVYAGILKATAWAEEHVGDWTPLVSESTFEQVQSRYRRKAPARKLKAHPDFPLRRFVRCGHCKKPLTGSRSTGRTGRYAYYHCPKCNQVRVPKETMEGAFVVALEQLQPRPAYLRLFKAVVTDRWNTERRNAKALRQSIDARIVEINSQIDRLERVFVFEGQVDAATYRSQLERLRDERAAAECELSDARFEELEIEGVLAFSEHVLGNLATLWLDANPDDRVRLQDALFPTGLVWDRVGFGTAVTNFAFSWLPGISSAESQVASPTIPSWNQIADFLSAMKHLRDSAGFAARVA